MSRDRPTIPDSLPLAAIRRVDGVLDRFEIALRTGKRPSIAQYLNGFDDPVRLVLLSGLIELDMTYRWQGGDHGCIDSYLVEWPELKCDGAQLVRLICCEYKLRLNHGKRPSLAEYRERFTELDSVAILQLESLLGLTEMANECIQPDTVQPPDDDSANDRALILQAPPTYIGRYRVVRWLGSGGFGDVYLAHDEQLDCPVAIKVPRDGRLASEHALAAFLAEARHVARLKHPRIVRVYNFGESAGRCFLVYEYIAGTNLAKRMAQGCFSAEEAARLVAQIADALHYAHGRCAEHTTGLYHRDIKPANILLDSEGQPHLTDFGLAVWEDELPKQQGCRVGTCNYMAPEQVRGDGNRIDGRTDIYSLGVVLYELLCGCKPFVACSEHDLFDQILHREPRPPRQVKDSIPAELERICLKALSKPMTGRYSTAKDMADDLRAAVSPSALATRPPSLPRTGLHKPVKRVQSSQVLPKGLRSFGPEDSDYFLQLLPGPRDRHGLPESVRFWKTRIESVDPDRTFAVGLMYGPSGCGKSSLIRSGVIPQLDSSVIPVYIEATQDDTEARVVRELSKTCPGVNAAERLADVLAVLCRRPSSNRQKVLIVIDQFEQWLHGHGQEMDISELLFALRQPDGESVAVLLLVRDDFWMGTSRVFEKLYINLDPDRNTRAVDLFDIDHAQYVLRRFGQAFGKLPDAAAAETEDQRQFLNQAVHELSENGRVISVRLSLFADLMKDRPWTLRSLFDMGGAAGVGLRFLEETFGSRSAVPERRALEKSARALLGSLLPETGTDIKAHVRADAQLAADCELPKGSRRFTRLLHILDHDLHLITPTETEQGNYYQLTHDYLIPQIEQWITFERRKSWRGRAKLCLEERTRQMQRWPQSRYVPSIVEYLSILLAVPRKRRRPEQQVLMRESAQVHGLRWGSTLAAMLVLVLGAFLYIAFNRRESRGQAMESIVANVLSASPDGLQYVLKSLQSEPDLAVPLLAHAFTQAAPNSRDGLHAAFALRFLGRGRELTVQQYLADSIASATPGECNNFITFLHPLTKSMRELLTDRFAAASDPEVKARFAIVLLHLGVSQPAELMLNGTDQVMLRTTFIHTFVDWHADLQTLRRSVSRSIILKDVDSLASLRSGLCSAVGLLKERPVGAEYTFLRDWLQWMFLSAPDGGTHSAADWALRQLGATVPYDRLTEATSEGQKRRWYTLSFDMTPEPIRITAVEVRPGKVTVPNLSDPEQPPTLISIDQPFFMLDREVWVDLFNAYYHDPDCPDSEKPEAWPGANPSYSPFGDCPVQSVSWYDAILFCNWLSGKLGRTKCYRRSGEKESMPHPKEPGQTCDVDVWEIVPGANGFRLPKDAEWILACQAGNTGLFCFGDDPHYLSDFASFASRRFTTSRGAEHLPNLFGLFDMHGNVHEWCWDTHLFQPRSPRVNPSRRAARGGSFQLPAPACASNQAVTLSPVGRSGVNGFRVVFAP